MPRQSAGILLYRRRTARLEAMLVHPGGPAWATKDLGAWSIPKGEFEAGADALEAAKREFQEETGSPITGTFLPLTPLRQRSGKLVHAWAVEGDFDPSHLHSNTFAMEWPTKSGRIQTFPEVDRAEWFTLAAAQTKILAGQAPFLAELATLAGQ